MKDAIRWILLGGALLLVLSCSTAAEAHDAAAVFTTAGGVGHVVTSGKDYEAEVEFRCDP